MSFYLCFVKVFRKRHFSRRLLDKFLYWNTVKDEKIAVAKQCVTKHLETKPLWASVWGANNVPNMTMLNCALMWQALHYSVSLILVTYDSFFLYLGLTNDPIQHTGQWYRLFNSATVSHDPLKSSIHLTFTYSNVISCKNVKYH